MRENPESGKPEETSDPQTPSSIGKSKEEIYLGLAQLAHDSFCSRRNYEWKVAYGLWAGIGIFTYFAVQNPRNLLGCWLVALAIVYFFIWLIWTLLWQPLLRRAVTIDKAWKHYYMHKAEDRSDRPVPEDPYRNYSPSWKSKGEYFGKLCDPWVWLQVLPTTVFLLVSFAIILDTRDDSDSLQFKTQDSASVTISGDNLQKVVDKLLK